MLRLSGPESVSIGHSICGLDGNAEIVARHAYHRSLQDPDFGETLDEGVVTFFRAPHSATGEDVVEFACHGGPAVVRALLRVCRRLGARAAEPGEFTFRAFRNGRVDLLEAEGIASLVEGRTRRGRRSALRSLEGELSNELARLRDSIVNVAVEVETLVEFPDDVHDDAHEEQIGKNLLPRLQSLADTAVDLAGRTISRRVLNEGVVAPLLGRPNVGKSSLFNSLLGRERAIVTPHPGTTRDTIEGVVEAAGVPLTLVDTAGLRDTSDAIEQIGVDRSLEMLDQANLVLLVVELGAEPCEFERRLIDRIRNREDAPALLLIANKADRVEGDPAGYLNAWTQLLPDEPKRPKPLVLCALEPDAAVRILRVLEGMVASSLPDETTCPYSLTDRQIQCFQTLTGHLRAASQSPPLPLDLIGDELRSALAVLGTLDGTGGPPDLFAEIFSRFCIGK